MWSVALLLCCIANWHAVVVSETASHGNASYLAGRYIAVLKENCTEKDLEYVVETMRQSVQSGLDGSGPATNYSLKLKFSSGVIGMVFEGDQLTASQIKNLGPVGDIENDQIATGGQAVQDPEWHLDRIDQHSSALNQLYYPRYTGQGIDIYILDSGMRFSHDEFRNRGFYGGYDAIDVIYNEKRRGYDCHGHGTHVAALAGGETYGVAKQARVYAIRILNCDNWGPYSGIIAALDYVMRKVISNSRRAIVSMSVAGGHSAALVGQIRRVVQSGIPVVVAAGNSRDVACRYSPADSAESIVVGGTQRYRDGLYYYTNYGSCVDIFAPGVSIVSASHWCDNCQVTLSGTSMSTPMVSGALALLWEKYPHFTPAQLKAELIQQSTKNAIDMSSLPFNHYSPNRLLYVEGGVGAVSTTSTPTTTTASSSSTTASPTTAVYSTTATTPATTQPPTIAITPATVLAPEELSNVNNPVVFEYVRAHNVENYYLNMEDLRFYLVWMSSFDVRGEQMFSLLFNGNESRATEVLIQADFQQVNFNMKRMALQGYYLEFIAPYVVSGNVKYITVFNKGNKEVLLYLNDSIVVSNERMRIMKQEGYELKYWIPEPPSYNLFLSAYIKAPEVEWISYIASSISDSRATTERMKVNGYYLSSFDAKSQSEIYLVFNSRRYGTGDYAYIFDQTQLVMRAFINSLSKNGWEPTLCAVYVMTNNRFGFVTVFWK